MSHLIELGQRIRALVELAAPTDANADHPRVVDLSRVLDDVIAAHDAARRHRDTSLDVAVVFAQSDEVLVDVEPVSYTHLGPGGGHEQGAAGRPGQPAAGQPWAGRAVRMTRIVDVFGEFSAKTAMG